MAATTISDLPRDALVLIIRAVLDSANKKENLDAPKKPRPYKIHRKLRLVSREWRDAVDIAYIELQQNHVYLDIRNTQDPATVRFRYPSMVHAITIGDRHSPRQCDPPITALAMSNLCASADVRRVLKHVELDCMCCADEVAAFVSSIVGCSHLTSLTLHWWDNLHGHSARPNMLDPLKALTGLKELAMDSTGAFPTVPDFPALTSLELGYSDPTFAPVTSDANLGRLRRLSLAKYVAKYGSDRWASNDPFRLRAAVDDGTWRPHLLTGLQELKMSMLVEGSDDDDADLDPVLFNGATPAAAVWAPLAATVTKLELSCTDSVCHDADLETGMYAGLGALTGLRALVVGSPRERRCPVDFGRVHLPHLTFLSANCLGPPIDLARFPRLVHVEVGSHATEPLVLSSVAALPRLATLRVRGHTWEALRRRSKTRLNLAQMFDGGHRLAALTGLWFKHVALAWDATAAPGAPSAPEFAARAGALLPSLRSMEIKENVEMEDGVREFVVPAVLRGGLETKQNGSLFHIF